MIIGEPSRSQPESSNLIRGTSSDRSRCGDSPRCRYPRPSARGVGRPGGSARARGGRPREDRDQRFEIGTARTARRCRTREKGPRPFAPGMPGPIRIGPGSRDPRGRGLRSIRRPRPATSPGPRRPADARWADALTQRPFASPTNRTVRLNRPHGRPQRKANHRSTNRTRSLERPPSPMREPYRSGVHRRPTSIGHARGSLSTHHAVEAGPAKGKCECNLARMAPKSPRFSLACLLQSASGLQKPIHTG